VITRRRFLQASLAAGPGLALGGYAWQIEPHWLEVVRRALPVQGLPCDLEGRTLAHLSDVHVGPQVDDGYILRTFDLVRSLAPDIVVFTGDFTSYSRTVYGHAERIYANAPRGRVATLGILGNHDYGPGWGHAEVAARLCDILRDAGGIRVLRNEVSQVGELQIAGMDDLWAGRFDPRETFRALDLRRPAIALSHNPDTVDLEGWEGFRGWVLSGHTHGGQCKAPFLPPPLLPVKNRRYTSGGFTLDRGRTMYISRGIGHVLQVRFAVRPEVTLFELQRA
jgi:predicted MPP superfamily phosphohydrolase